MAKVRKAHKSNKQYSFQRKKINTKLLLIILAVIVVAGIGLKVAYDKYVYGELTIAAPSNEKLDFIASNWQKMNADPEHFINYYSMYGLTEDGTDGAGSAMFYYIGSEKYESVILQVNAAELNTENTEVAVSGIFQRTKLADFINGVAPWGQLSAQYMVSGANCQFQIVDDQAETLDETAINEVLAEIEALINAVEEAPAVEETPAEPETPAAE